MRSFFEHYWIALLVTFILWALVGWQLGTAALITTIILTLLETTLSADNAVVNSRVLVKMSPFWQKLFMTVGIFIAVFVVRFALPIVLVMIGAGLDFVTTLNLALNNPEEYGNKLHSAEPYIHGFGGVFLLLVATHFFVDKTKSVHWLPVEKYFATLDRFRGAPSVYGLIFFLMTMPFLSEDIRMIVLVSGVAAVILYSTLHFVTQSIEKGQEGIAHTKHLVGKAAFAAFLYLEVIDASFSLDGVIGAFAITNNAVIIMAGLGAGAIWVREITLHLVRTQALVKYKYIESGAQWAILFLSLVMLVKLFGYEFPEWFIGSIGLGAIVAALISSHLARSDS